MWKDSNENWFTCSDSPYIYPNDSGPFSFNCFAFDATAIELRKKMDSSDEDAYITMAEMEVYTFEWFKKISINVEGTVDLTTTLTGPNYGSISKKYLQGVLYVSFERKPG